MRRIVLLLISLFAVACSDATSGHYAERPHGTVSIAYLKSLAHGDSTTITDDISIEGYVIANDLFGEYYKSIVISDQSGGIEIGVDIRNTAVRFPISARTVVHCSGLALGNYGGRLMLGAVPEREYTVDRIAESDIDRYMLIDCSAPVAIEPTTITIADLSPALIGNYVRIDDLSFEQASGLAWCDSDPITGKPITTQRTAYDSRGNAIAIRIIAECDYHSEVIPAGRGTLFCVVEYFNSEYSLRIVNHGIVFQ
ncbi:MAG: hypothetical protein IJ431_04155 [Alistipes sp.]|nr:hypothetical protein [Alistipes sp.]